MCSPIELIVSLSPGNAELPQILNPDGSRSPFVIPARQSFVATDISANRISVVGTPVLLAINLEQDLGPGGTVARWQFVGEITQNVERSFTTGIQFAAPFKINLLASTGDSFSIRINGLFM